MCPDAKNSDTPPKLKLRRIIFSGGSYLITVPRAFIRRHQLQAGDRVGVVMGAVLTIIPLKE